MSDAGFLGVTRSLTGRRWAGPPAELTRRAAQLAQQTGLPDPVAQVLARAGVSAEAAPAYLEPRLRDLLPDPSDLADMDRAVALLAEHLSADRPIAVFADYDVDGAASAALLHDWLAAVHRPPRIYIPDRIEEGYGPNVAAMTALAADHGLIVCVDCGTLAYAPITAARAAGAQVIVLDHHLAAPDLPDAVVVNPNRQDADGALAHLCAAAVVFLFLVAANRARRAAGLTVPDPLALLDLVALATVADVAPLIGVNRALVRQGLKVMARRGRPGLVALADTAGLDRAPAPYHLGYVLGPRINAGGRIGRADLGARLLTAADAAAAAPLAEELERLNGERRAVEAAVKEEALAQVAARGVDGPLVWAAGAGWHPGVVGIVAARLKETFQRPAVVIGLDGNIGKGSGRSVTGIDLGAAVAQCTGEGLLTAGGGHKMAAGLTVDAAGVEPAMARLAGLLARQGADALGPPALRIDTALRPGAANVDLLETLDRAGPFGAGAPAPRFAFAALSVAHTRPVGQGHLALSFFDGDAKLPAILFGADETPLGAALRDGAGRAFHVAGHLERDDWRGRSQVKLRLEDAAPAD
ncbi:MAG: single-stranded-DNA-specific exonuclease RecJ [Pseudomonadota bacterium]